MKKNSPILGIGLGFFGSPGRTRTADKVVNSHPLYQLSYRGLKRYRNPLIKMNLPKSCSAKIYTCARSVSIFFFPVLFLYLFTTKKSSLFSKILSTFFTSSPAEIFVKFVRPPCLFSFSPLPPYHLQRFFHCLLHARLACVSQDRGNQ